MTKTKKAVTLFITLTLFFLCACSSNIPDDFVIEDAKSAVANYYLHHFVMIDADEQITYIGFDAEENRAEFFVSESVNELLNGTDMVTGTFYVTKDDTNCYVAKSANANESSVGTYRSKE